jgi:hypothetical protein
MRSVEEVRTWEERLLERLGKEGRGEDVACELVGFWKVGGLGCLGV